jgi:hypothetical protein
MESVSALEQNHRSTDSRVGGGRSKAAGETPVLLCPSPRFGCGVKIAPWFFAVPFFVAFPVSPAYTSTLALAAGKGKRCLTGRA